MSEIDLDSYRTALGDYLAAQGENEDFSDADLQALLEQLLAEGEAQEAEFQAQFDKNFQTMSYIFMKEIYTYADDETQAP